MIKQLSARPVIPSRIKRRLKALRPLLGGEWELKTDKSKSIKSDIEEFKAILKAQLRIIQNGKCAYCGLTLGETSRDEIEHFAPKGGRKRPKHLEYTFEVINLVLACNLCNSPEKKGTYDTIVQGKKVLDYRRCKFRIVHPYLDDHSLHYSWANGINSILIQGISPEGKESIRLFKLDSTIHSEARAKEKILEYMKNDKDGKLLEKIMTYNPL
ncbi:hypothetical protein GN712_18185 [Vibrio cholerae]|uniref:hypothetical protein n=1 Tax=Vibrio cholerae TaxID=666 RepID=UPI00037BF197|nr:hypothetical protein [Vibrio cholerae]EGQ8531573.1 hypothetical protein [Vibrio cholerae]EGQ8559352.1 hypothetical protein [Vibrio cholerae]RNE84467.1 hypothetical protein EEJ38_17035 [Vibrio cholerae]